MKIIIDTAEVLEYIDIVEVWEASVRATHGYEFVDYDKGTCLITS